MIMFGGDAAGSRAYSDVFVLSMPSFTWVKIKDSGNPDLALTDETVGRQFHTCQLYGDRQMIVLGGAIYIGDTLVNNLSCNSSYATVAILDTTTFEWQEHFNPRPSAYAVSDQLQHLEYIRILPLYLIYVLIFHKHDFNTEFQSDAYGDLQQESSLVRAFHLGCLSRG